MSLYTTLGVEPSASYEDIHRAFRRAARKHHPDVGGDVDKFKEAKAAYEVLSDRDRRDRYDRTGDTGETTRQALSAAEQLLVSLVADAFLQEDGDPIRLIRSQLHRQITSDNVAKLKLESICQRHQASLEKFRDKNRETKNQEGYQLIEAVLKSNIASITAEAQQHAQRIDEANTAFELIRDLACPTEIRQATSQGWPFSLSNDLWTPGFGCQ